MNSIIKIRFLQIYRELVKAGWMATFVSLILYGLIVLKITQSSIMPPSADELVIIFALIVFSIHSIRKDKRTLKVILNNQVKKFYFLEYLIFSFPFIFPLILHQNYLGILLFYFLILLTIFLDISINLGKDKRTVWLSKFIEKDNFEWIAGMKKIQYLMIVIYIFSIILSYWHFAGFICLAVITFLFSNCYNECESQFVLTLRENSSNEFINNKLKKHLIQYFIFISPILFIYFIHYPDKWIFYLPLLIVYIANYIVYILNKYKSYTPNQILHSNGIIVAITATGMFIPYLFPISLILVFVFYSKSIHNLKTYFHA